MLSTKLVYASLLCLLLSHPAFADLFGSGANQFSMDFVPIGNPGNADDTSGDSNPAGKVEYVYRIAKYEVSRDMITKANTVGSIGITMADMTSYGGNGVNRPATGVSWNEAARFVNWLNTSQGFQAAYNFTTTGVNDDIAPWSSADAWQLGGENLFRHKDAKYWLPSMDEWYKAAYYDPSTGAYFDYPTGSNYPTAPTAVSSGTGAETAVSGDRGQSGPADINQAGGLSPYGVMGLGGNVWELEETELDLVNDSTSSPRGIRRGLFVGSRLWFNGVSSYCLSSSFRTHNGTASEDPSVGFRVASLSAAAVVP